MDRPQKTLLKLKNGRTWAELGELLGFSAPYLHDVASGKKPASSRLLEKLNLERITRYRERDPEARTA